MHAAFENVFKKCWAWITSKHGATLVMQIGPEEFAAVSLDLQCRTFFIDAGFSFDLRYSS